MQAKARLGSVKCQKTLWKLPSRGMMKNRDGLSLLSDRKSTRLNSSHRCISYAVFCLKKAWNNLRTNSDFERILEDLKKGFRNNQKTWKRLLEQVPFYGV